MDNILIKLLTENEQKLRELFEQQKKQSKILDSIINTTNNLKDDVNQLRKEL